MALIQTVHLSMANFKSAQVVPAVQNDTDRQVKMIIDDYTLTSGLTGKIAFKRSDGTHYETAAELVLEDNAFTADIDQALTQPGRTMVQLKVTDTLTVSTFSFVIFVEADTTGTVTPQEGIDLVAAVEAAEAAADRAESAAEDAEESAVSVDADAIWDAIELHDRLFQTGSINQWDESWENGFYNLSTGIPTDNANYVRSKYLIPVAPSTSYFYKVSGENYIAFYDKDKTYISTSSGSNARSFTTPSNAYYIGISFASQTYGNNVSVNYPSTDISYHAFNKLNDKNNIVTAYNNALAANALATALNSRALQQGHTTYVRASNYGDLGITSLLSFGENKYYGIFSDITSAMISGLPSYGTYATLIKFSPTGGNAFSQIIFTTFTDVNGGEVKDIFTCCGTSGTTFTPWKRVTNQLTGKSFSIIGDSYSTYSGWNPVGNDIYYPADSATVKNVGATWWYLLSKKTGMSILMNDSYSGATVCTHVRPAHTTDVAYVKRIKTTMGEQRVLDAKPDIIFVLGGQNDMQVSAEVGEVMYSGWTADDLYKFAPAFCYMLDYLITYNPSAQIVNITNTGLTDGIISAMATACSHYGVKNIVLSDIDKDNMHPTATGMQSICNQVISGLI